MALRWDAPLLAALAAELRERLHGARLQAVHAEFAARRLALHFREHTLVVRLHPDEVGLLLLDPVDPPEEARRLPARLRDVTAPPDDRILLFSFLRVRGSPAQVDLALEFMTNQYNAVLTRGPERTARLVFRTREGDRPLRQGHPYRLPDASPRQGVEEPVAPAVWMEHLLAAEPRRRKGALLSTFAWTSQVNAPALLGAAASGDAGPEATRAALEAGYETWTRIGAVARGETAARPVLLETRRGLQPYPLPLPGVERRTLRDRDPETGPGGASDATGGPGLLELLRTAADDAGGPPPAAALLPAELVGRLEEHVAALRRRTARLEEEAAELADPARMQHLGDLILARFAEVPEGAEAARLTDFDGEPVTVDLDPALPPDENAARYYDRAARIRRAMERLPKLQAEAREAWQEARALLARARSGDAGADEVEAAVPVERRSGDDGDEGPTLPYRTYRSSGGLAIRVGRGAKRNDDLTFRNSNPDDIWLHARHTAGAHVILRWNRDDNPPHRDLHEAAVLAALHSRARTSGSVPVDWTRRKYVRKPRKAPPGAVVPDRVQTVFVTPDEAVEARLRDE